MKNSIILQGTENQLTNLKNAMDFTDNEIPQQVETIVCIVNKQDCEKEIDSLTDEEFIDETKKWGRLYDLKDFQKLFNEEKDEVNHSDDVIRFINVPTKN